MNIFNHFHSIISKTNDIYMYILWASQETLALQYRCCSRT